MTTVDLKRAYKKQMVAARLRNIEWLFTYETWIQKWNESGFLHLRGRGIGATCMARNGPDIGPYAPWNVTIKSNEENASEGNSGKTFSEETRKKLSLSQIGRTVSAETKRKISVSLTGRSPSEETRKKQSAARTGVQVGEKNGASRLTDGQVLEIRRLHATGKYFQRELGDMFEVSREQIGQIVRREQWKHI